MSVPLGTPPDRLTVYLSRDADFFSTLQNADEDWPITAQIELRFPGDVVWTADIDGPNATFNVDLIDVNTVIDSKTRTARLFYIDGEDDICWASGLVVANG